MQLKKNNLLKALIQGEKVTKNVKFPGSLQTIFS